MNNQSLRLPAASRAGRPPAGRRHVSDHGVAAPRRPLGRILVDAGVITGGQLARALRLQLRLRAPVGEILVAEGWAEPADIVAALARQHGLPLADLAAHPPAPALAGLYPPEFWLRHRAIPLSRLGAALLVATSRPDLIGRMRHETRGQVVPVAAALAGENEIDAAVARNFAGPLVDRAETRVAARFSCRNWRPLRRLTLAVGLAGLAAATLVAPLWLLAALCLTAFASLALYSGLKLAGFVAGLAGGDGPGPDRASGTPVPPATAAPAPQPLTPEPLPKVSVIVPLYRETEIAGALIERLGRLSYPRPLLDVVLVLEENDSRTRQALDRADLPRWIRVAEVPARGRVRTKPRAMNYALDFCRGDIIGVWDAEDAPDPGQIEVIARRFAGAPPEMACLQGVLDYYNPRTNWLSRCFTIEYASWFRIVLPGIARLGLVVPLGGTTLFVRRSVLELMGGWDAHNVTEDADLGVRLARAGYRTEMVATVTGEEANCRAWPWVRQRSRWLKGFMVTYAVHMRSPRRLWADLGGWRFWGFQAFFLGTVGQFLLAPVLWSFWLLILGFGHPALTVFPRWAVQAGAGLLIFTEVLGLVIGLVAVSRAGRRFLIPFVPTMAFYFPLGAVAAVKALAELLVRPFFWDKTRHGRAGEEMPPAQAVSPAAGRPRPPVSGG